MDSFIVKVGEQEWLIDHHSSGTETLRLYLKRHILRSKVKILPHATPIAISTADSTLPLSFVDPRLPQLGTRIYSQLPPDLPLTPSIHYEHLKQRYAIPESPIELIAGSSLPLESNIDFLNGVDFKKGCYVGQELTARTHFRGVVRKRIVGLRFTYEPIEGEVVDENLGPPVENLIVKVGMKEGKRLKTSGSIASIIKGEEGWVGMGLVRLEHITESDNSFYLIDPPTGSTDAEESQTPKRGRWLVKTFIPDWLRECLEKEEVAKARQRKETE